MPIRKNLQIRKINLTEARNPINFINLDMILYHKIINLQVIRRFSGSIDSPIRECLHL